MDQLAAMEAAALAMHLLAEAAETPAEEVVRLGLSGLLCPWAFESQWRVRSYGFSRGFGSGFRIAYPLTIFLQSTPIHLDSYSLKIRQQKMQPI